MTIVIGMLASDGLVIAADTQETVPGYWKNERGKIAACGRTLLRPLTGDLAQDVFEKRVTGSAHCLVAGAGHSFHLTAVLGRLVDRFTGDPPVDVTADVVPAFTEVLEGFYSRYIWALPPAYPVDQRPTVQIITGYMYSSGGGRLLASDETLIQDVSPYVAVGIGRDLAYTLLGRLYRLPMLDVWQTAALASYVMFLVKESIDGCGKRTDISCLVRDGQHVRSVRIPRRHTAELEGELADYCGEIEPAEVRWIIGDTGDPGPKRRAARRRLQRLLTEISAPPKNA